MPPPIIQDILVRLKANTKAFANQMRMPPVAMRKMYNAAGVMNKNFKKNITTGQRWALGIRKMTHGLRGFRMEMLGVMFFGMGLQKFFTGLLRPALEAIPDATDEEIKNISLEHLTDLMNAIMELNKIDKSNIKNVLGKRQTG